LEKLDGWRARKEVIEDIQKLDLGRTYPYLAVAVLLIQWEDHDLGSCDVVDELRDVFTNLFGFESIGTFKIPSHGSIVRGVGTQTARVQTRAFDGAEFAHRVLQWSWSH